MINFKVKYSLRCKRVILRINDNGELVVTAPKGTPNILLKKIVKENNWWIEKNIARKLEYQKLTTQFVRDNEEIYFLGDKFKIAVKKDINNIIKDNKEILIPAYQKIEKLIKWYKKQAKILFVNRVEIYKKLIGVIPNKVKLSSAKTRWGSCSAKGNINLNWKLIFLPLKVIDYVIVHELVHLKYFNHSKEFWGCVEEFYPDYKYAKKYLKKNNYFISLKFEP